jgi:hypothetical protein
MTIPAGISTALVHMDAPVSFIGEPGRLYVRVEPSASLVWEATGTPLANFFDALAPDNGMPVEIELPHTDQEGFIDGVGNTIVDWFYTVKIKYEKDGQIVHFPSRDFQIPTGQTDVDLALVPSGEAFVPSVAPILPVTSIQGLNGSVTLADLGLDAVATLLPDPEHAGLYLLTVGGGPPIVYDGGNASSTYTPSNILDGGSA